MSAQTRTNYRKQFDAVVETLPAGKARPRLLLHAASLSVTHPVSGIPLTFHAPLDAIWRQLLQRFGWLDAIPAGLAASFGEPVHPSLDLFLNGNDDTDDTDN